MSNPAGPFTDSDRKIIGNLAKWSLALLLAMIVATAACFPFLVRDGADTFRSILVARRPAPTISAPPANPPNTFSQISSGPFIVQMNTVTGQTRVCAVIPGENSVPKLECF